jgi:Icc-related predicted phosphoesterase
MKILAVSDVVLDRLYSGHLKEGFPEVSLVLGCGDLPYEYLEFLASALNVPVIYVPGNHDPKYDENNPAARADGCQNIDLQVTQVKGLTLVGMGGSIRYQPNRLNQYTQVDMYLRLAKLIQPLALQRLRAHRPIDIVIAHSPPRGIHDEEDSAHIGFDAFLDFIRVYKPRYFLHGHTTPYKANIEPSLSRLGPTTIINVNPYRFLELDEVK